MHIIIYQCTIKISYVIFIYNSCVFVLIIIGEGVIVFMTYRDHVRNLKDSLDSAQRTMEIAQRAEIVASKIVRRVLSDNKITGNKLIFSRRKNKRKKQLIGLSKLQRPNKELESAQLVLDEATSRYDVVKQKFDNDVLWLTGLQEYSNDYAIETRRHNWDVQIFLKTGNGKKFDPEHGHYTLSLKYWEITCHRGVNEPHSPDNHTRLGYELPFD